MKCLSCGSQSAEIQTISAHSDQLIFLLIWVLSSEDCMGAEKFCMSYIKQIICHTVYKHPSMNDVQQKVL